MKKKEEEQPKFKTLVLGIGAVKYKTLLTKKFENRKKYQPADPNKMYSFIPGTVVKIHVKEGQEIKKGHIVLILEAMKMKNELLAPHDCVVKKIYGKEGERVAKSFLLVELEEK